MARGESPASSQAAKIASIAMSNSERPRLRENGVCPMPTMAALSPIAFIATSPRIPPGEALLDVGGREHEELSVEHRAMHDLCDHLRGGAVRRHHPAVSHRERVVRGGIFHAV